MLVDINLLPEKERERSTFLIAALAIIGAALLIWAAFFLYSHQLKTKTIEAEAHIATLQVSQEEIRERLLPALSANDREQLEATVAWAEDYRFITLPLLRELIALLPERGYFVSYEFTAPHQAKIVVQFDDKSDAAHYLTSIKSTALVSEATIESLIAEELTVEEVVQALPRFVATYVVEFFDEREAVVEIEGTTDIEVENEVGDTDE